jgi:Cytochrome c554 and c-prime
VQNNTLQSPAISLALFCALLLARPCVAQLSTAEHLQDPGFWPTQSIASQDNIVGPSVCLPCHRKMTAQQQTPMARNASLAGSADILHSHPDLSFTSGRVHYAIKSSAASSTYTVTDGTRTLVASLLWAFGLGRVGQSYLFKKPDGNFYEARVTYFTSLRNLNFTPARALTNPANLEEAMYRPVPQDEIIRCFSCHTTASVVNNKLDERNLIPGVTCEACHGPGAKHSANMYSGSIFNPAHLEPADSIDFCGACHGAFWDIALAKITGPNTARSQPYRLETSKCWRSTGDARLTCMSCHDPHQQLQTDPLDYDHVCTSCHSTTAAVRPATTSPAAAKPAPAACPVAKEKCVSCHMPKVYVPDMHDNFTDHRIRIAHAGEAFPE